MAIAFGADALTVDSDGGSVVATQPAGVAAGHLVCGVAISYDQTATAITLPSGWSAIGAQASVTQTGQSWRYALCYKILAGGDSYTFTFPATYTNVYLARYTGHHATTPFSDTATFNSGTSSTATGLSVTVGTANSFLLYVHIGYTETLSVDPAGFTNREPDFDSVNNWLDLSVGAGATGDKTATVAASSQWSVAMAAIAPAAAGGATSEPADGGAYQRNVQRNAVYRMNPRGLYVPERAYGFLHAP